MPRRSRARRHVTIDAPPRDVSKGDDVTTAKCCVHLSRRDIYQPWGFSMTGGIDQGKPLCVTKVMLGGPATGMLEEGEVITKIDNTLTDNILHQHAVGLITNTGLYLKLTVQRERMTSPPQTSALSLPSRRSRPTAPSVIDAAPLPPRRAGAPVFEWAPLPAENPTFRPTNLLPPTVTSRGPWGGTFVAIGGGIKGYAPVPFTLGAASRMTSTRARSQSARRPARPLEVLTAAPLSSYYTTPFYTTPDVAIAGVPAAATRTVEENLPYGLTPRRAAAPPVHPFRSTMVGSYPFRTAPRIGRVGDDDAGPCILMHM